MPFVTKNPAHYFSALAEESTEPLHVGLYLSGSINEERRRDLIALGKAIRQTQRPVRCLWLRFRDGDESLLEAFNAFGEELVNAVAIQSLVFEGKLGTDQVQSLSGFFTQNKLRGLQFRRTDVDRSTFTVLKPFFYYSHTLKVLDMSSNPGVGDECMTEILDALVAGKTRLETLNIGEMNLDGEPDETNRISGSGVASIASFVSKTPSLSSITLRLRHLDDIGIGEISLIIRREDCSVRRLDVSGNFGNSGVKIFAEALKTNTSLRTVSFGCYKNLSDVGGQVLLDVVDPFSQPSNSNEWDNVIKSNHTLQSVYILDRPTVTVNKGIIDKLQSISTLDPHHTLQSKCWSHIEKNIDDISHLGLAPIHMPQFLAFVHRHGTMDDLFRLIKSQNTPELFTNPSPERARLSYQMDRMEQENEILKELLVFERDKSEELHQENKNLRRIHRMKEDAKQCCLLPISKLLEMWNMLIELIREPSLS
ncbi:hypothetical protein ACHAWF_007317 [Thalassiosira exigua]